MRIYVAYEYVLRKAYLDIYKSKFICLHILFEVMRIAIQFTETTEIISFSPMTLGTIRYSDKMHALFVIPSQCVCL